MSRELKLYAPVDCDNAPRKTVLRDFLMAFYTKAENLTTYLEDDIIWSIVGKITVTGKITYIEELKCLFPDAVSELHIDNIITHGNTASVNGKVISKNNLYYFCKIFEFAGFKKNAKIRKLTSFIINAPE